MEYARKRSATTKLIFQSTLTVCRRIISETRSTPSKKIGRPLSASTIGANPGSSSRKSGLSQQAQGQGQGQGINPFLTLSPSRTQSPLKKPPSPFGRKNLDLSGLRRNVSQAPPGLSPVIETRGGTEAECESRGGTSMRETQGEGADPIALTPRPRGVGGNPFLVEEAVVGTSGTRGGRTEESQGKGGVMIPDWVHGVSPVGSRVIKSVPSPSSSAGIVATNAGSSRTTKPSSPHKQGGPSGRTVTPSSPGKPSKDSREISIAPATPSRPLLSPMHHSLLKKQHEERFQSRAGPGRARDLDLDSEMKAGGLASVVGGLDTLKEMREAEQEEEGLDLTPRPRRGGRGKGKGNAGAGAGSKVDDEFGDGDEVVQQETMEDGSGRGKGLIPEKKRRIHLDTQVQGEREIEIHLPLPLSLSTSGGGRANVSIPYPPLKYHGLGLYLNRYGEDRGVLGRTVPPGDVAYGPRFLIDRALGTGAGAGAGAGFDAPMGEREEEEGWVERMNEGMRKRRRVIRRRRRMGEMEGFGMEWRGVRTGSRGETRGGAVGSGSVAVSVPVVERGGIRVRVCH
jgi:hypothetical protein